MVTRDPLTRYWFINELARTGALASVEDGWITRRLQPHGPPSAPRPEPRPHTELREVFARGDATHRKPFKPWPVG